MRHLYGIPNCSTVKKARAWLEARQIDYVFHDFKKEAPTAEWLAGAIALMCAYPSLIKRPVLTGGNGVLAGFDEAQYAQYVQAAG